MMTIANKMSHGILPKMLQYNPLASTEEHIWFAFNCTCGNMVVPVREPLVPHTSLPFSNFSSVRLIVVFSIGNSTVRIRAGLVPAHADSVVISLGVVYVQVCTHHH